MPQNFHQAHEKAQKIQILRTLYLLSFFLSIDDNFVSLQGFSLRNITRLSDLLHEFPQEVLQTTLLHSVSLCLYEIYHLVYILLTQLICSCLDHNSDDRLCTALSEKKSSVVSKLCCYLIIQFQHISIIHDCILA